MPDENQSAEGNGHRAGWVQFGPHPWQVIHPEQASEVLKKLCSTEAGRNKFGRLLSATITPRR